MWSIVGGTIHSGLGCESVAATRAIAGVQAISVYYVDWIGCTAASQADYPVTVNALPIPAINGAASVCNNTSSSCVSEIGLLGYVWTITGGVITSGQGRAVIDVDWNTIGDQTLTVTYTDGNGCIPVIPPETTVTVADLPNRSFNGSNVVCENQTYTYSPEGGAVNL